MTGREKEIVRHLSEDDLDRLLTQTDDEKVSKRLTFLKRLLRESTEIDLGLNTYDVPKIRMIRIFLDFYRAISFVCVHYFISY